MQQLDPRPPELGLPVLCAATLNLALSLFLFWRMVTKQFMMLRENVCCFSGSYLPLWACWLWIWLLYLAAQISPLTTSCCGIHHALWLKTANSTFRFTYHIHRKLYHPDVVLQVWLIVGVNLEPVNNMGVWQRTPIKLEKLYGGNVFAGF